MALNHRVRFFVLAQRLADSSTTNRGIAPKKDWSLNEWIANFLQDDYDENDALYEDMYDDGTGGLPGDDSSLPGEIDDVDVLESLLIVGLAALLIGLVMYRQQRQQAARRRAEQQEAEAERRRRAETVAAEPAAGAPGAGGPPPGQEMSNNVADNGAREQ